MRDFADENSFCAVDNFKSKRADDSGDVSASTSKLFDFSEEGEPVF
jgi:hypothetical protein